MRRGTRSQADSMVLETVAKNHTSGADNLVDEFSYLVKISTKNNEEYDSARQKAHFRRYKWNMNFRHVLNAYSSVFYKR